MLSRSSPGVIHCRRSAAELGSFFFEPVQLHVQLADLTVQLLDHRLVILLSVVLRLLKHPRNVRQQPPFPLTDQIAMHAKLACQLAQRLIVLQRGQCNPRLERGFIPLPHALLAHARELLKWVLQPRILHLKLAPSFWGPPQCSIRDLATMPLLISNRCFVFSVNVTTFFKWL